MALLHQAWVERERFGFANLHLRELGVSRIDEVVELSGDHRAGDAQRRGSILAYPFCAKILGCERMRVLSPGVGHPSWNLNVLAREHEWNADPFNRRQG